MSGKAGQTPLPPWGNALAGATGAVLANAIVYPLDMYADIPVGSLLNAPTDNADQSQNTPTSSSQTQCSRSNTSDNG